MVSLYYSERQNITYASAPAFESFPWGVENKGENSVVVENAYEARSKTFKNPLVG